MAGLCRVNNIYREKPFASFRALAVNDRYNVLILGHGEMGQAMEYWLRPRHDVAVWQRQPRPGRPLDLSATAAHSDFVLFCLPAAPHFELATRLRPVLRQTTLCISIAKGLDDSGRTAAQVFHEVFARDIAWGVLHGPMISEEIRAGRPAFADFASLYPDAHERLQKLFAGAPFVLRATRDVFGASWSAVLKNVYAILFGIADGLELGDNMRGWLAVETVREIETIVTALGGSAATPYSLAGLGDLITTATSTGSHHHELGRKLARGEPVALDGEGIHTLKTLYARRPFRLEPYPLLRVMHDIVEDPARARAIVEALLQQSYRGA